jgi:hypothetical protein
LQFVLVLVLVIVLDYVFTVKTYFDHEKLDVYREAINFCAWVGKFLAAISVKAAAKDQLDRASTSISLNIAEGSGKFSRSDRARFFEIARGQHWNALPPSMFSSPGIWRRLNRSPQRRKSRSNRRNVGWIAPQVLASQQRSSGK